MGTESHGSQKLLLTHGLDFCGASLGYWFSQIAELPGVTPSRSPKDMLGFLTNIEAARYGFHWPHCHDIQEPGERAEKAQVYFV